MANRFGICEWSLPERGTEAIRHAARLGFDGIQLTECGGYEEGFPLLNTELQNSYKSVREETGITFQALHLFSLCRLANMIHPSDTPGGKVAIDSIKAAVQVCETLDIPTIMVTSGFMCAVKNRDDFETFAGNLKIACEIAGEKDQQIAFESGLSAEELLEMRELTGPGLKICYDFFNPIRFHMEKTPAEDIQVLGTEMIDHFHTKDGPSDMLGCSLLGEGVGNYYDTVSAIKKINYKNGWFITENYYAASPLNRQGSFDDLCRKDLETMRNSLSFE